MPSRRSGHRSHSGCKQCKERRVKCDETLPVCKRCLRNGRDCSLRVDTAFIHGSTIRIQSPAPARKEYRFKQHKMSAQISDPIFLPMDNQVPQDPLLPMDIDDNTLHHYNTTTCHTIAYRPEFQFLFGEVAPALSETRPFLKYTLQSLSGCHKIAQCSWMRTPLTGKAMDRMILLQRRSIELKQNALQHLLANMTKIETIEDMVAVSLAGILLFYLTLAVRSFMSPGPQGNICSALDTMVELMRLRSGLATLWVERDYMVTQSVLVLIKNMDVGPPHVELASDLLLALAGLSDYCDMVEMSDELRMAFSDGIIALRGLFQAGTVNPSETIFKFGFIQLEARTQLADLIEQRHPIALAMLAFAGIALHDWPGAWWCVGFGQAMVREAYANVPPEVQELLSWPLKRLEEVPLGSTEIYPVWLI